MSFLDVIFVLPYKDFNLLMCNPDVLTCRISVEIFMTIYDAWENQVKDSRSRL